MRDGPRTVEATTSPSRDLDAADVSAAVDEVADADPLAVALAERDEYLDSLRRLQAEFENYKKRVAKQQTDQVARAAASLVDKLLPGARHPRPGHRARRRRRVRRRRRPWWRPAASSTDVLAKEGLERIDPSGEAFDPNAHEAVGHLPATRRRGRRRRADRGAGEPVVAQVMRAGYRWHGTVVRPAMVMVGASTDTAGRQRQAEDREETRGAAARMVREGLLQDPRRVAHGHGQGDHQRVPEAGQEAPPRHQPGQRGALQGDLRGLRRPR